MRWALLVSFERVKPDSIRRPIYLLIISYSSTPTIAKHRSSHPQIVKTPIPIAFRITEPTIPSTYTTFFPPPPKQKRNRAISRQSLRPFPQPFFPLSRTKKREAPHPRSTVYFHSSFDITIPRFMESSHKGVSRGDAFIVNVCIFFAFVLWRG